ncbi:hypothetical protein AYO45_01620 [Gammaproteobacteria bacterium SCGC AG-212-F23]|nr:hypothetical protein AYO45_01620 [Gammaproteobacteria bacterium SCGC AG-212-F23]
MKPSDKNQQSSIITQVIGIIIFLALLPGLISSGILFYFSGMMIYQKIYLWLKFGICIDTSIYNCLITNPNYCKNILSNFPFENIPHNFINWLYHPTDWLGLHSTIKPILETVPLWIAGFICAIFIFFAWLFIVVFFIQLIINICKKAKEFIDLIFK